MRYLGTVGLFFAVFFWVLIFAGPSSGAAVGQAARIAQATQAPLTGLPAPLTEQSDDTWTTTVYLGTAALCEGAVSYDLVTTAPNSATLDKKPMYLVPGGKPQQTTKPPCAIKTKTANPDVEVILSFTPLPPLTAAPQTATLVVTPVGATTQASAPLDLTLPVHRQVSAAKYLWIPFWCGLGLAVLLVVFTALFGVPRPKSGAGNGHRVPFLRVPLYASAAWSFSDSWATNITAVGTVVGTVLTASGSVSELLPGVELGRFSLLIAVAGGITVAAPLLFGALNYHFASVDPTTAGVAEIWLPPGPDPGGVELAMSAGGSITVYGPTQVPAVPAEPGVTLNPGASLEVPAGSVITMTGGGGEQVLAVPGSSDVVVFAGKRITVNASLTIPVSDIANAAHPAAPRELPAGTGFDVPGGAKISFLGQATMTLPDQATVKAPVAKPASGRPWHDHRHTVVAGPQQFAIPNSGEVVAGKMWTMLMASCMTVFGIGAELGIVGWVLGYDLVVGPQWARDCSLAFASAAAVLVLCYGVSAICALADSREGTALSGARNSSFML